MRKGTVSPELPTRLPTGSAPTPPPTVEYMPLGKRKLATPVKDGRWSIHPAECVVDMDDVSRAVPGQFEGVCEPLTELHFKSGGEPLVVYGMPARIFDKPTLPGTRNEEV